MTQVEILSLIDAAIAPKELSQRSALTWLEDLISELESRADGLREDLRRSGELKPWRYNSGALLSDEEVPGLTQDMEPDSELRRLYGGRYMICETLGEGAARRIAHALGRDLVVGPEAR